MEKQPFKLFCDLDGVLCDFPRGIKENFDLEFPKEWIPQDEFEAFHDDLFDRIDKAGSVFWENLFPMPDGLSLWNHIKQYDPSILTAYPSNASDAFYMNRCKIGKRRWVRDNLGLHTFSKFNICYSKDKHLLVDPYIPSILIDDRKTNIKEWINAGGIGILHTDTKDTIEQLEKIVSTLFELAKMFGKLK